MDELLKSAVEEKSGRLVDMLAQCIVPIFKLNHRSHPQHFGTGFLISTNTDIFIVSAAHVLEARREEILFMSIRPGCIDSIDGNGALTELPQFGGRDADNVDIGALKVTAAFGNLDLKHNPKKPLSINTLSAHALPKDNKSYLLVGSRSNYDRFQREIRIRFNGLMCLPAAYENYAHLNISPFNHLVLNFNEKQAFSIAGARTNRFPPLEGMSGSPVFLFEDKNAVISPFQTPIVGVFTGISGIQKKLLVTDIGQAIHFIQKLGKSG
jgi:hypothetical protein